MSPIGAGGDRSCRENDLIEAHVPGRGVAILGALPEFWPRPTSYAHGIDHLVYGMRVCDERLECGESRKGVVR